MTINDIVKETIQTLNSKKIPLTPHHYQQTFCQIAARYGFSIEECRAKEKFIGKLNETMQEDIGKYNVNTLDELLTYLVSSLNRLTLGNSGKQKLMTLTLIKHLLEMIARFPDQKSRELAKASMERIEHLCDLNTFEILTQKWESLLASNGSDYTARLQSLARSKSNDFHQLLDQIENMLEKDESQESLSEMASIVVASLTPSLTQTLDDEISTLSYMLNTTPELLHKKEIRQQLKTLIHKRIEIDKTEVKDRILSIDEILSEVSTKIIHLIDNTDISYEKVKEIKQELVNVDKETKDFETIKKKLLKIAESLEFETKQLGTIMKKEDHIIAQMQMKIKKLEQALKKAKQESKIDFLTGLVSKRGLDEELNRVDKSYRRFQISYSIGFFDIDHFKNINDTYGHEAGDLILKQMGKIFLELKRDVDIVGRYGGEEFLAILPNTPLNGAQIFAEKIREYVEHFKFIYKGEEVPVTISVGVASCTEFDNQKTMIEEADKRLYTAKKGGRNRVEPPLKVTA